MRGIFKPKLHFLSLPISRPADLTSADTIPSPAVLRNFLGPLPDPPCCLTASTLLAHPHALIAPILDIGLELLAAHHVGDQWRLHAQYARCAHGRLSQTEQKD